MICTTLTHALDRAIDELESEDSSTAGLTTTPTMKEKYPHIFARLVNYPVDVLPKAVGLKVAEGAGVSLATVRKVWRIVLDDRRKDLTRPSKKDAQLAQVKELKDQGYTQSEIANLLKITQPRVSLLLKGKKVTDDGTEGDKEGEG